MFRQMGNYACNKCDASAIYSDRNANNVMEMLRKNKCHFLLVSYFSHKYVVMSWLRTGNTL